ncbi:hypothetical protein BB560_005291 [Smittium megazygosporum]|uniref:20S-pre-rRNA D-site endonuclease NOB1 n=1 Tax=Smittium megazygosporum TaxID=133381 RepID=A0A2T9Z709_9FUNG|nr:hypothetical protein BB560_005291 [Smittium megazygosporum]
MIEDPTPLLDKLSLKAASPENDPSNELEKSTITPQSNTQASETSSENAGASNVQTGMRKYKYLVVDTNPLLKGSDIYPLADKFVTTPDVLKEIVSKQARDRLAFVKLKLQLEIMEPEPKYIAQVVKKAKETGDFASISITDIKVIALALMLQNQSESDNSLSNLPRQPEKQSHTAKTEENDSANPENSLIHTQDPLIFKAHQNLEKSAQENAVDSFFTSQADEQELETIQESLEEKSQDSNQDLGSENPENISNQPSDDSNLPKPSTEPDTSNVKSEPDVSSNSESLASEEKNEDSDEQDLEWSVVTKNKKTKNKPRRYNKTPGWGGEWITPENLSKAKLLDSNNVRDIKSALKERSSKSYDSDTQIHVGCITSDYAMQNTILSLGIKLVSLDGYVISQLKTWVMRCHACYATTPKMDAQFCDSCGHPTLIRTSISSKAVPANSESDPDNIKIENTVHLKKNFVYRLQGTKYGIPAPKGGRKSRDIITRADDKLYTDSMKRREILLSKIERQQLGGDDGIWDINYVPDMLLGSNSKSKGRDNERFDARGLPIIGFGKRNPNKAKKTGNRKKKSNN